MCEEYIENYKFGNSPILCLSDCIDVKQLEDVEVDLQVINFG